MSMRGGLLARPEVKRASVEAQVIRCGCGNPASHVGAHCPRPRKVENRGVVSYWHRNPLKRWWWSFTGRAA
jgi:hypothetical protein